jgi:hypothetical protein
MNLTIAKKLAVMLRDRVNRSVLGVDVRILEGV